jgi:hypothetical protein
MIIYPVITTLIILIPLAKSIEIIRDSLLDDATCIPFINTIRQEDLQTAAVGILEWNESMLKDISVLRTQYNIPDMIDVGVYMTQPAGSRRDDTAFVVNSYINTITDVDNRLSNPPVLNVFIASNDSALLQDFIIRATSSWKIHMIPQLTVSGFSVASFDRQQARVRLQAYKEFIAILSCLQTSEPCWQSVCKVRLRRAAFSQQVQRS